MPDGWDRAFVPSKASEWPDEKCKVYWIGPFYGLDSRGVKKFWEAYLEEESIYNTRRLAESLYEEGDFAGARYAWAQIADHYISEYQHAYSMLDFGKHLILSQISKASVGGILSTYFKQYPDLCAAIKADNENSLDGNVKPDRVFAAVLDRENNVASLHSPYITRVILSYDLELIRPKDHNWRRIAYQKALDTAERVAALNVSETVRLRQGLVHAIVEDEMRAYWRVTDADLATWNSLGYKQKEEHRIQSTLVWKDEVERLHLQTIADLQRLHGTTAEATIASELDLVSHYKAVKDTEKAEARARKMLALTKTHFGEDHDSSFRCMASLSNLLIGTGSVEEAGLLVHDVLTRYPGLVSPSLNLMPSLQRQLRSKYVTGRGWKEIALLGERLERLKSPFHFIWADYRLYTLRTGTITFVPSYPKNTEKEHAWGLAYREPKHKKDDDESRFDDESPPTTLEHLRERFRTLQMYREDGESFAFSASERDQEFLDLRVHYIPYRHFMTTSEYESGTPYLEYVKATEDLDISRCIYEEATADTPIQISGYLRQRNERSEERREFKNGEKRRKIDPDATIGGIEKVEKHEHAKLIQPSANAPDDRRIEIAVIHLDAPETPSSLTE